MPQERCYLAKGPLSIPSPPPRGWWHGREVVVISFLTSLGCLLCHTSTLSATPGIGTRRRRHRWSRASCHGNAERCILEVFLEGETVGASGGGDGGRGDDIQWLGSDPWMCHLQWPTQEESLLRRFVPSTPPPKSAVSFKILGCCSLLHLRGLEEGGLGWFIKESGLCGWLLVCFLVGVV